MTQRKEANLRKPKIIISGGGTGGHIFPAIAIANALKKKFSDHIDILFVGAQGRMEMEKVPAAGYKIEGLWISGLQRKLTVQNLSLPFKIISSWLKARKILKDFKPDVVIGVGGYASGIIMKAATQKKIPTLIQEQNSYPGITNKVLAPKVNKICVAYEGMDRFFPKDKIKLTGNPVRQDILNIENKRERGLETFGLSKDKKVILIIGGSLGARTINESINTSLEKFKNAGVQIIWQTGKTYYPLAQEAVKQYESSGIKAYDFISKMDYAYAVADLVISRAGASSVSELCLVNKPCILVPSPNVAEDHQTKNAMALVNHHAAILIKDNEARQMLGDKAIELLHDNSRMEQLSRNIGKLALRDSADVIANEVVSLIK